MASVISVGAEVLSTAAFMAAPGSHSSPFCRLFLPAGSSRLWSRVAGKSIRQWRCNVPRRSSAAQGERRPFYADVQVNGQVIAALPIPAPSPSSLAKPTPELRESILTDWVFNLMSHGKRRSESRHASNRVSAHRVDRTTQRVCGRIGAACRGSFLGMSFFSTASRFEMSRANSPRGLTSAIAIAPVRPLEHRRYRCFPTPRADLKPNTAEYETVPLIKRAVFANTTPLAVSAGHQRIGFQALGLASRH